MEEIRQFAPSGIIFTGGPSTVYEEGAPKCDPAVFEMGVPVLGICYGQQLMTLMLGGTCKAGQVREYGKAELWHNSSSLLFEGVRQQSVCWMSHTISVDQLPEGFVTSAKTKDCPTAAIENPERKLYGVQFHPEVMHTEEGTLILENFLYKICGLSSEWTMAAYSKQAIEEIRQKVGNGRVLLALSGGVDSSVAAALISQAVGNQLTCVFVDHGLLRKDEGDMVEKIMGEKFDMNIIRANVQDRFLTKLQGVTDPEQKRKIIGEEFIRVFEEESRKDRRRWTFWPRAPFIPMWWKAAWAKAPSSRAITMWAVCRTMWTSRRSSSRCGFCSKTKCVHLGRGAGPAGSSWYGVSPSRDRVWPCGSSARSRADKLAILREADAIFREEIANAQAGPGHQPVFCRADRYAVGGRHGRRAAPMIIPWPCAGVTTTDFMTADWARIPYDVLEKVSIRIVNEVPHINRIVYDITSKPPATVEWE